ncbi:hypothetical protein [Beijerinckia mobilis]|uniref:hypothetical protein n=1 Tax=Beijerinckia mobilis TaxID=231434 RepID=UPI00055720BE|nr:hypothetical protein [Beijerinckia mobilis]
MPANETPPTLLSAIDSVTRAAKLTDGAFMAAQWMEAGMERDALSAILDTISDTLKSVNQTLAALQEKEVANACL